MTIRRTTATPASREGTVKVRLFTLEVTASKAPEFIDITDRVVRFVQEAEVREGLLVVFSRHTTAAVRINENEPLLLQDLERFLERAAPRNGHYLHNDFSIRTANLTDDECPNGHAHCQHLFLGTSEAIPIHEGRLLLGRWQRVFLIELDHPRRREVAVQVIGV